MKLTVLVDNNTFIDEYLIGEPALSIFIECKGKKILFDTGYSDAFMKNARELGVDLLNIDKLVLSHGHLDHTLGLKPLTQWYEKMKNRPEDEKPTLVTHPFTLERQAYQSPGEIAELISEDGLEKYFELITSRNPVWITDHLIFLGEIERTNDFEATTPFGKIVRNGVEEDDFLIEDSALAYKSPDGLVIITGCSHSGICNIVEYARKVCGDDRVVDIIGGFHLQKPSDEKLRRTVDFLKALDPDVVHACHCTDLESKIALAESMDLREVGVGLRLEY